MNNKKIFRIKKYKRIFAIGDVHGCYEHLRELISKLEKEASLSKKDTIVFIGDLIDRGPHSYDVISYVKMLKETYPNTYFCRGNHEDMMLSYYYRSGMYGESWFDNGGHITKESIYEVCDSDGMDKVLDFIGAFHYIIETDKYYFVHAGFNPDYDIKEQDDEDLLWIRNSYIQSDKDFGKKVISGHTMVEDVCFDEDRKIMIDTGCFITGKLSCIELPSEKVWQVEIEI